MLKRTSMWLLAVLLLTGMCSAGSIKTAAAEDFSQYIGTYSTNWATDRGTNPENSAGYDCEIYAIANGNITFGLSFVGNNWSPLVTMPDNVTAPLQGNSCEKFNWTDSQGNGGYGSLRLENGNVTINMTVTEVSPMVTRPLETDGDVVLFPDPAKVSAVDNNSATPQRVAAFYKDGDKTKSLASYPLDHYLVSTDYDPELAELAMVFAAAAYDQDCVLDSLKKHGFSILATPNYDEWNYLRPALALAEKTDDNNNRIIAIMIRGSKSPADWLSDFGAATIDSDHGGFRVAAGHTYALIRDVFGGIPADDNTKYFITGHSYGAAVANLLTVDLMADQVQANNIFTYTFATPNVAKKDQRAQFNPNGKYGNIFNICNTVDPVTNLPANTFDLANPWSKYGNIYTFRSEVNSNNIFAPHSRYVYLDFLARHNTPDPKGYLGGTPAVNIMDKLIFGGVLCPVDINILHSDGELAAQFINNQPNYFNGAANDLILYTLGDEKYFVAKAKTPYILDFMATDQGTMDYFVQKYDPAAAEVTAAKYFRDVSLTPGKQMTSAISFDQAGLAADLFVLDETGEKVMEILAHDLETSPAAEPAFSAAHLVGAVILLAAVLFVVFRLRERKV